ncbi:Ig-like domain-containing protein [Sodalis sp. dw_96]|uniref:Ig-like domain-containing protein n=1 Tax=Sodalis sp. dw_96 TaxID=2719794 RepID=UPI001BD26F8D|nr:Ig-like domain-containing protein [Sodalis sp. dw_96]
MHSWLDQPILPAVDYTLTIITVTSGAAADGIEFNLFTVRLSAGDELIDNAPIEFTVSGNALFTPSRQNFTTVYTNNQGEATVFFTNTSSETIQVRATFGSDFADAYSTFGAPASDNDLLLEAEVTTSNIGAGSGIPHIIDYRLITPAGLGVPNRQLNYSVIGSATLVPTSDITDGSGRTQLRIFSDTPGSVTVVAVLASAPDTVYIRIILTFINSVLTQRISAEVQSDMAQGNGFSVNRIRYQVLTLAGNLPVANVPINFSVTGGAELSVPTGNTDGNGYITLTLTNSMSGAVRVSAALASGLGMTNYTSVTFL